MPEAAEELRQASSAATAIGPAVHAVLLWVFERQAGGEPPAPAEVVRRLEGELGGEIHTRFLIDPDSPAPDERLKRDLLTRLRQQAVELEMEGIGFQIRSCAGVRPGAGAADSEQLSRLLERKQSLAKQLARLREPEAAPPGYQTPTD
jgi:hypothetical protein